MTALAIVWVILIGSVLLMAFILGPVMLSEAVQEKYNAWDKMKVWVSERLP